MSDDENIENKNQILDFDENNIKPFPDSIDNEPKGRGGKKIKGTNKNEMVTRSKQKNDKVNVENNMDNVEDVAKNSNSYDLHDSNIIKSQTQTKSKAANTKSSKNKKNTKKDDVTDDIIENIEQLNIFVDENKMEDHVVSKTLEKKPIETIKRGRKPKVNSNEQKQLEPIKRNKKIVEKIVHVQNDTLNDPNNVIVELHQEVLNELKITEKDDIADDKEKVQLLTDKASTEQLEEQVTCIQNNEELVQIIQPEDIKEPIKRNRKNKIEREIDPLMIVDVDFKKTEESTKRNRNKVKTVVTKEKNAELNNELSKRTRNKPNSDNIEHNLDPITFNDTEANELDMETGLVSEKELEFKKPEEPIKKTRNNKTKALISKDQKDLELNNESTKRSRNKPNLDKENVDVLVNESDPVLNNVVVVNKNSEKVSKRGRPKK